MNQRRNWIGPYIPQGSLLRELVQQAKLAYNLMLDARVHPVTKLIPLAALGYLLLPTDVMLDVVPVLGQVDDVAVLLFGLRLFFEFSPAAVVQEHLQRLAQRVQGDWQVMDDAPSAGTAGQGEIVDDDNQS
ncbi:MAG: DUF1232 domain-containing protein [Anaerolineales bacterium]|nr:DUF1232 domain-containing protein [Anaerolineales bacterium]